MYFFSQTLDIVIPTRNRHEMILETLESLLANPQSDIAIWVIDQSDQNGTLKTIKDNLADERINYVRSDQKGSNVARNLGISLGQAPLVAFTDDDCVVADNWVEETLSAFEQADIDAVFGRVIDQSIGLPGDSVTAGIKIAVKNDPNRKEYKGNRFRLDYGHGACMAFRRKTLDRLDGFDPLLGNGGPLRSWPERDIGYRILHSGGTIVYEPNVVVHHKQWRSWKGVKATMRNYGFGAGAVAARYLKKGDLGGLYLMLEWQLDQGVRQVLSGIIKWRSWQKIWAGLIQMAYPIYGFCVALTYPADFAKKRSFDSIRLFFAQWKRRASVSQP